MRVNPTCFFVLLIFCVQQVFCQITAVSPYSLYGVGELSAKQPTMSKGMGGAKYALVGENVLNMVNPANLTNVNTPIFNLEISVNATSIPIVSYANSSAFFNQAAIALPINKKYWSSILGISPRSKTGYSFKTNESFTDLGNVNYTYSGKGGIDEIYFGNGFNLIKDSVNQLSVGVTVSYLFGSIDRTKLIEPTSGLKTSFKDRIELRGYEYEFGFLYQRKVSKNSSIAFGGNYRPSISLKENYYQLTQSFTGNMPFHSIKDTIFSDTINGNRTDFPQKYGAGIAYYFSDKLIVTADYSSEAWSAFNLASKKETYNDRTNFGIGFQYIPNQNALRGLFKRMQYRTGFRYTQSHLNINGINLNEYGITFGLGIPISTKSKSATVFNISYEYGQRGKNTGLTYKETLSTFNFGFILTPGRFDRWFVKPKID